MIVEVKYKIACAVPVIHGPARNHTEVNFTLDSDESFRAGTNINDLTGQAIDEFKREGWVLGLGGEWICPEHHAALAKSVEVPA